MKIFLLACICTFFYAGNTQTDVNVLNDLLKPDVTLSGPGVRARLTLVGTSYVSSIVAKALTTEVTLLNLPNEQQKIILPSLPSVTLSSVHLRLFDTSQNFNVQPLPPSSLNVQLENINLSVIAVGEGSVDGVAVEGPLEIRTNKFSLQVNVRVGRNEQGNPHLKLESCSINNKIPVTLAVQKALTPETGAKLADAISKDAQTLLESMVCPRLAFIIDTRINQRFGFLSTKISLGDTKDFDLVRSLTAVNEALRRKTRQDSITQNTLPMDNQNVMRSRSALNAPRPQMAMRPPTFMRQSVMRGPFVAGSNQRKMVVTRVMPPQHFQGPVQIRQTVAQQPLMVRAPRFSGFDENSSKHRFSRQANMHAFLSSFNLSRADDLILNYGLVDAPVVTPSGVEIATSGEITSMGMPTPFGPRALVLPSSESAAMLQIIVSDYVPNTLMYHGHKTGLFNTRVDPSTAQFGSVMRTTCDVSTGSLFCVGDLFPTLREMVPNKGVAFMFSTLKAPSIAVAPESQGGIKFQLIGLIEINAIEQTAEIPVGRMEIHIDATMRMKLSARTVRGRVQLDNIQLITKTPKILVQEELDDAGFLSREILQRMVNDILKQGIPIPVHPLFKLQKPKLTLMNRSMLLETNFQLNQNLIRQLTSENLVAA